MYFTVNLFYLEQRNEPMSFPWFFELLVKSGNLIIKMNPEYVIEKIYGTNHFLKLFPLNAGLPIWDQIPKNLKDELYSFVSDSAPEKPLNYLYSSNSDLFSFNIYFEDTSTELFLIVHEEKSGRDLELELQRSEARFRIVIESAAQGILLMNVHGRITMVNSQIEQIFGYTREELLDTPVETLLPPMYREIHNHKRNSYLANPVSRPMAKGKDISGRHKNGNDIPVEINLSPIELYDGLYIIAFVSDISERNRLQNKIRRIEKLEAIGQLAGGIAHDFNNVLAGIIGLTELALRKLPPHSEAESNLKMVVNKAQSAADLVKQLLAFSRQQILRKHPLNFNSIVKSNKKMLQRYLGEDILLHTDLSDNLSLINADSSAMDQILTNLCINARDAMPDGGELIIKTENINLANENISIADLPMSSELIKITIQDTGIGMRKEVQKHIFEPFYSTKEFGQGTGLGLSSVYGLVEQHHGMILVDSKPGEGTQFKLYFPVYHGEMKSDAKEQNESSKLRGNETILFVDDEEAIVNSVSESLSFYGYNVLTADNGISAMKIFETHKDKIDLIISDLIMPERGGIELKMIIQSSNPNIKFLHISGYSDRIDPQIQYLKKPFLTDELVKKIREILDN